jgi:serine/threonine protein kinase
LKALEHPSIVRAVDIFKVDLRTVLVMEYERGKLLADIVNAGSYLPEGLGIELAANLTSAVEHMASRGYAHRALTSGSVILKPHALNTSSPTAVLIGFSKARQMEGSAWHGKAELAFALDVWGVGMTTAEALTGRSMSVLCDLNQIQVDDRDKFVYSGAPWIFSLEEIMPSACAVSFVKAACTLSPSERPSIAKLKDHPFLERRTCTTACFDRIMR